MLDIIAPPLNEAAIRRATNRIALRYGVVIALTGLTQILVSSATGRTYATGLIIFLQQVQAAIGNGYPGVTQIDEFAVPLLTSSVSCLLGGTIALILASMATSEAVAQTGNIRYARRSGMYAFVFPALLYIAGSLAACWVTGSDNTFAMINPYLPFDPVLQRNLLILVGVRGAAMFLFLYIVVRGMVQTIAERGFRRRTLTQAR